MEPAIAHNWLSRMIALHVFERMREKNAYTVRYQLTQGGQQLVGNMIRLCETDVAAWVERYNAIRTWQAAAPGSTSKSDPDLIPMNAVEGSGYEPPSPKVCETFAELLKKSGIRVTMRKEKGSEIAAACGQLKMQSKGHAKKPVPRKPPGDVKIRIKKRT